MKSIFLAITLIAATSFAAEKNSSKMSFTSTGSTVDNPIGFVPLVGASVGYMGQNDTLQTGGVPSELKILGSYYFAAPIVADLGIGLMSQGFNKAENRENSISGENYELAARYKFANRWQAGAIVNAFGGNAGRYGSSDNQLASFAGVQALKEFTVSRTLLVRAGGRLMTDLNINDEQVNVGMIDVELGWAPESATVSEPVAQSEAKSRAPSMTYTVDAEKFHFATGEAKVEKNQITDLESLSAAVAKHADLFEKVEVIGHADERGAEDYNQQLSSARAQTVAEKLIQSGLQKSKVETVAKGESEPLINTLQPEALRQNRRVEIKFMGVKDQAALEKVLGNIK